MFIQIKGATPTFKLQVKWKLENQICPKPQFSSAMVFAIAT